MRQRVSQTPRERRDSSEPLIVGRYAIYDQIGAGGMASVHLGRLISPGFSRTVAIKRLHAHLAAEPEVVAAFKDEARLAARVRHPNVVAMLDVVSTDDEEFLVMEYVEGVSLSVLLRAAATRGVSVPRDVAVAIATQTLHGLHAAHEAKNDQGESLNVVHRDVSPQNVLIGVDGMARVLDFGIAKAIGRSQTTRDGSVKGKLAYMAPEQIAGRAATRKVDVFAAGVVLWEMLTLQRLFSAEDDVSLMSRVLTATIVAPGALPGGEPHPIDAIVLRCLERDPTKRYHSAEDVAIALEEAIRPASPRAVAEWMNEIVGDSLAAKRERVREIERHSALGTWSGASSEGYPLRPRAEERSEEHASASTIAKALRGPRRGLYVGGGFAAGTVVALGIALVVTRVFTNHAPPIAASSTPSAPSAFGAPSALTAFDSAAASSPLPVISATPAIEASTLAPSAITSVMPSASASARNATRSPRAVPKPAGSTSQKPPKLYSRD